MEFSNPLFLLSLLLFLVGSNSISNNFNSSNKFSKFLFINDSKLNFGNFRSVYLNRNSYLSSQSETSSIPSTNYEETSKKIKLLKNTTGRGIQDCYKALNEAKGDVRMASQILMNTLLNKKTDTGVPDSDIVTSLQGTIAISCSPRACTLIDMRCDTDFVGKNAMFTGLAKSFANAALNYKLKSYDSFNLSDKVNTFDTLRSKDSVNSEQSDRSGDLVHSQQTDNLDNSNKTLEDLKKEILNSKCLRCGSKLSDTGTMVKGALRESIAVARIGFLESDPNEFFVFYVHSSPDPKNSSSFAGPAASVISFGIDENNPDSFYSYYEEDIKPNDTNCCMLGNSCVYSNSKHITDFRNESDTDDLKKFLRQIAVHVVAEKPIEMDIETYDKGGLEESKKEFDTLVSSGKTPDIAEKIVKGKLKKKYGQTVLMEQVFTFGNGTDTISHALDNYSKKLSKDLKLKKFLTFAILDDLINFKQPQNCTFYNTNIKF